MSEFNRFEMDLSPKLYQRILTKKLKSNTDKLSDFAEAGVEDYINRTFLKTIFTCVSLNIYCRFLYDILL